MGIAPARKFFFEEKNLKEHYIAQTMGAPIIMINEDIDQIIDHLLLRAREKEKDLEKRKPKPGWRAEDISLTGTSEDVEYDTITVMKSNIVSRNPRKEAAFTSKEYAERIETILRRYEHQ
jgi:hypothetical protein